jgi:DNA-directed RNA polymerase specialized sigma24 family protein
MTTPEIDADETSRVYNLLFHDDMAAPDMTDWYDELNRRLASVDAACELARRQRAVIIAYLHDERGLTYAEIAKRGGPDKSRLAQLAAMARAHLMPELSATPAKTEA